MGQLNFLEFGLDLSVPRSLLEATISPFFGADGGNVESPIWFCALEPGGGFSVQRPCRPKSFRGLYDKEALYLKPASTPNGLGEALVRPDGSSIVSGSPVVHQVFVLLLTAIITGKLDCKHLFGKKVEEACINLINEYEYFQKDRHGLILNAYPIPMAKHVQGDADWRTNPCVKVSEDARELATLAQWTTIPKLKNYLQWCASVRHRYGTFGSLRRRYTPAIVYCGGRSDKDNFFRMWIDAQDQEQFKNSIPCKQFAIKSPTRTAELNFDYLWLDNGKGTSPTLLVVGPFFGPYQASCLTDPITCELLGIKLRDLLKENFSGEALANRFSKFLP